MKINKLYNCTIFIIAYLVSFCWLNYLIIHKSTIRCSLLITRYLIIVMADFHNITTLIVKKQHKNNNNKQYVHLDSVFLVSPIENMSCNRKTTYRKIQMTS